MCCVVYRTNTSDIRKPESGDAFFRTKSRVFFLIFVFPRSTASFSLNFYLYLSSSCPHLSHLNSLLFAGVANCILCDSHKHITYVNWFSQHERFPRFFSMLSIVLAAFGLRQLRTGSSIHNTFCTSLCCCCCFVLHNKCEQGV